MGDRLCLAHVHPSAALIDVINDACFSKAEFHIALQRIVLIRILVLKTGALEKILKREFLSKKGISFV